MSIAEVLIYGLCDGLYYGLDGELYHELDGELYRGLRGGSTDVLDNAIRIALLIKLENRS